MLSSEFNQEMGALIRRLETKVRREPELTIAVEDDPLENIERAIVTLVALHIELQQANKRAPE